MTRRPKMTRWMGIQAIILAFLLAGNNLAFGSMTFDLFEAGTFNKTVTVPPGANIALGVVASNMTAEGSAAGELDAFSYRIVFSNEQFILNSNVFGAPFDNTSAPLGFNGSIPWTTGSAVPITNRADAGSPGANLLAADIYRTTASETGMPASHDVVVETLEISVPQTPGVYPISLEIIEAVDRLGEFHTADVGAAFNVNVLPSSLCPCDLNGDSICDEEDLRLFGESHGWGTFDCNQPDVDCPCDLVKDAQGTCNNLDGAAFREAYARSECRTPVYIEKVKPQPCEPGDKIRIIGSGFGTGISEAGTPDETKSVVHVGVKQFEYGHRKIKLWTENEIKVKIPRKKYTKNSCAWFKGQDSQTVEVGVTVGGLNSNKKTLNVKKPVTCP
jgi:hypothetical protein